MNGNETISISYGQCHGDLQKEKRETEKEQRVEDLLNEKQSELVSFRRQRKGTKY